MSSSQGVFYNQQLHDIQSKRLCNNVNHLGRIGLREFEENEMFSQRMPHRGPATKATLRPFTIINDHWQACLTETHIA